MANSNPVTKQPADPATTETKPVTPAPEKAPKGSADPLAKFKTEVNGLSVYNFVTE